MNTQEITTQHAAYVMPTYAPERALVRGEGRYVWDAEGNRYLDFLSGIAVTSVGHAHPHVVHAIREQAGRLMHVSNLYFNELQPRLAQKLSEASLGGKCFFCNSGAEANEALIKLARLWGHENGRYEIVTMQNSFHGRTLATLTATGQEKVKKGFDPLPQGFVFANLDDIDSVRAVLTDKTAAVLVEPVQGEGGVRPADGAFMSDLEALCRQEGLLLLCDEVQSGTGRTGKWFAYQHYDITPDAVSTAKGLGGGFPIGAIVAGETLSDVFHPGSHATTFGGTPLACAAALAVLEVVENENLMENASARGAQLMEGLQPLVEEFAFVDSVRGVGLMVGLVLHEPAKGLERELADGGLLALATAGNVIRFLPALNVSEEEVSQALSLVRDACTAWAAAEDVIN